MKISPSRKPTDRLARRSLLIALPAAALVAASGCNSPEPSRARFADMTFEHRRDLRLEVFEIEVRNEYRAPLSSPNVEHLFPITPEAAMRRWARDRLEATGTPGRRARFIIKDAKVIEEKLSRTGGIRGMFTRDQTERYTITLEAALEVIGSRGMLAEGFATARAVRARTVGESITVSQREHAWYELLEEAMRDLDVELERRIRGNLAQYLR